MMPLRIRRHEPAGLLYYEFASLREITLHLVEQRQPAGLLIDSPAADGAGCLDVFLPGVVEMLPHYMHKPVKAGAFFLEVRHGQQKADQVHEILNRVQAIAHT